MTDRTHITTVDEVSAFVQMYTGKGIGADVLEMLRRFNKFFGTEFGEDSTVRESFEEWHRLMEKMIAEG